VRILHIINSLGFGGAESVLCHFARCVRKLHHAGWQVDICVLYSKGHLGQLTEAAGIRVHTLRLAHKYDARVLSRLLSLVRREEYDIVHVHLFPSSLYAALLSFFKSDATYVFTEHSVWNRRRRYVPLKLLDAFVYSRYSRIIAVSESARKALEHWLPHLSHKIVVIPNGIPIEDSDDSESQRFKAMDDLQDVTAPSSKMVLFVGGLRYPKGADILLRAAALIDHQIPFQVWIAGDGTQRQQLEELAGELERRSAERTGGSSPNKLIVCTRSSLAPK